jgi:hypothetical protein
MDNREKEGDNVMTKEQLTTQNPESVRLLKYRSSLMASGGAMELFTLWTVLRSIVEIDNELSTRADTKALMPIVSVLMIVSLIDLVLKLYVGLSARREALGRNKKKRPYLVLGIIIAALSVVWVIYILFEFPGACRLYGPVYPIVTLAVEATALYAALDLVFSAKKVRQIEEEMGRD